MANAGPNSNGCQFFVTVAAADWLSGKHTIFGEVTDGYDVVEAISRTPRRARIGRSRTSSWSASTSPTDPGSLDADRVDLPDPIVHAGIGCQWARGRPGLLREPHRSGPSAFMTQMSMLPWPTSNAANAIRVPSGDQVGSNSCPSWR